MGHLRICLYVAALAAIAIVGSADAKKYTYDTTSGPFDLKVNDEITFNDVEGQSEDCEDVTEVYSIPTNSTQAMVCKGRAALAALLAAPSTAPKVALTSYKCMKDSLSGFMKSKTNLETVGVKFDNKTLESQHWVKLDGKGEIVSFLAVAIPDGKATKHIYCSATSGALGLLGNMWTYVASLVIITSWLVSA